MKNYFIFYLTVFISSAVFSQNKTYLISNEMKQNKTGNVFEVKNVTIKSKKYKTREVDNPKYLSIKSKINSLNEKIENLKEQKHSDSQIQFLVNAKSYLKKAIDFKNSGATSFLGEKWTDIKYAKKELDKSGLIFQQTIKKKYSLAIEDAKKNILKIDNILGENIKKDRTIGKLKNEISEFKRKINSPFNPIKKRILKDVPVSEVERNILILDTINVFSEITGKFIAIKNDQYNNDYKIMKQDYKEFVKNELVLGNIIQNKIEDAIGSVKNLNRLTDDISTYIYRDENDNSYYRYSNDKYLIKNVENDKLYYTTDNILDKIAVESSKYSSSTFFNKNNIELFEKNNKKYVKKNGQKCILTEFVKKELLNKNFNIIQQTASSVNQYNTYYINAIKLLDLVTKHRQSYNSKTMTTSRLEKWKSDLKKLISINKKMDDIHYGKYKNDKKSDLAYQYFMHFSKQLTREQVQAGSIIPDVIRECKILIGM